MLPKNNQTGNITTWLGWLTAGLLLIGTIVMWYQKQLIVDTVQYYQYTPTSQVGDITKGLRLTDDGKFTFYASQPSIETSETFNQHCTRQEADSPILGCYSQGMIYIYDITDERLAGIQEVTAAHELLHAEYERLSVAEKARLEPLLQDAYDKLGDAELEKRMEYYQRTQPGEMYNELHSIIPTEYPALGDELEQYYKKYFQDRKSIALLHQKVDSQFKKLSKEADELVSKINALAADINSSTKQYNSGVSLLNAKVSVFNVKANTPGGFATQSEFQAARASLERERQQLESLRQQVKSNIATYKQLVAQLEAINAETESLNASIDSVLSDEPAL